MPTQYLKPKSVDLPSQGAFEFRPVVLIFEEMSAAALQVSMTAAMVAQTVDATQYFTIESIDYEVTYKPPPMDLMSYSALVHATEVKII